MKILLSLLMCGVCYQVTAQSLIANGSFEDLDGICFVIGDSTHFGYQPITCIQPWGQYANTQMVMSKSQYVRSGVAASVVKIYAPAESKTNLGQSRSYLIAPFQQELTKDSIYKLTFYYKLWHTCRYSSKNLGIVFGEDKQVDFNDYSPLYLETPYQLTNLPKADDWQNYSLTYRATGNERFLLIGNVATLKKTKLKIADRKQSSPTVQLLIDDISFVPLFSIHADTAANTNRSTPTLVVGDFKTDSSYVLHQILFRVNSADLLDVRQEQIDELLIYMREHPNLSIYISGHTDIQGSDASNLSLSQNRAEAVKQKLVSLGISPERIVTKGYGSQRPIADNRTESGRSANRRVEVLFAPRD